MRHPPTPGRIALILPTTGLFRPGEKPWSSLLVGLTSAKVDVLALTPFGPVPPASVRENPFVEKPSEDTAAPAVIQEATARIRAWGETDAVRYAKIVLLKLGPLMPAWTAALAGTPTARKTQVVMVPTIGGLHATALRTKLETELR